MNKLITVAVIDSGIYPHIDFKNRIVAFKDFVMQATAESKESALLPVSQESKY